MNIKFADKETFELFHECSFETENMEHSLNKCLISLMRWHPHDGEITISRDFAPKSFFFSERTADGKPGMCGGIIFHGEHDNGGDGSASTLSVNLNPIFGYSIHT